MTCLPERWYILHVEPDAMFRFLHSVFVFFPPQSFLQKVSHMTAAKPLLRIPALILCGILLGTVLMVGAYSLRSERLTGNVRTSAQVLAQEGSLPLAVTGFLPSRVDSFSDVIMTGNTILSPYDTPLENAMRTPRLSGFDPLTELEKWLDGEPAQYNDYARYWHGYLIFLVPMMTLMSISSVRLLLSVVLILLLLHAGIRLSPRHGVAALLAFFVACCPQAIAASLIHESCMLIALAGVIGASRTRRDLLPCLLTLIGMATSFFDLFTTPLMTLVLPLSCVLIREDAQPTLKEYAGLCLCWLLGYLGMWAGKWAVGSILTGENIFRDALATMQERSVNADDAGDVIPFTSGFLACLHMILNPVYLLTFAAAFGVSLCATLRRAQGCCPLLSRPRLMLGLTALMPVVWTLCICNHSLVHSFHVYRTLSSSFFPLVLAVSPFAGARTRPLS